MGAQRGSLVISDLMAAFWCIFPFAVAAIGVFRKRSQSVVRMRFSPDQARMRLRRTNLGADASKLPACVDPAWASREVDVPLCGGVG